MLNGASLTIIWLTAAVYAQDTVEIVQVNLLPEYSAEFHDTAAAPNSTDTRVGSAVVDAVAIPFFVTDGLEKLLRVSNDDLLKFQETHSSTPRHAIPNREKRPMSVMARTESTSSPANFLVAPLGQGTVRPRTEWWTTEPNASVPKLPQCCDWHGAQNKAGYPCQRGLQTGVARSRYIGPGSGRTPEEFLEALRGKKVVLVGDSQTRAWFEALACYTSSDWNGFEGDKEVAAGLAQAEKIKAFNGLDIGPMLRRGEPNAGVGHFCYGHGRLTFPEYQAEILSYSTNCFDAKYPSFVMMKLIDYHTHAEKADIILPSLGAWFNDCKNGTFVQDHQGAGYCDEYKEAGKLYNELNKLMSYCSEADAPCVTRETQATHWVTAMTGGTIQSGLFEDWTGKEEPKCFPSASAWEQKELGGVGLPTLDQRANWRNGIYHQLILEKHPNIQLMEVWERTLPNFDSHFDSHSKPNLGDCTHFTFDQENFEPLHLALADAVLKSHVH